MMTGEDFDKERLRAEIAQERQMKDMLEQSLGELQLTVSELEKRIENIGSENNEWKTRYETQVEMNEQLDKQILSLSEKVDDARDTYNQSRQPKSVRTAADLDEVSPFYVKRLEKEKHSLEGQLRDLEWRLDQESKAYHKANEERKGHQMEITAMKGSLDYMRKSNLTGRESETPRTSINSNIPQNQRILDPRHGPIKKTAAVKNLPRLN